MNRRHEGAQCPSSPGCFVNLVRRIQSSISFLRSTSHNSLFPHYLSRIKMSTEHNPLSLGFHAVPFMVLFLVLAPSCCASPPMPLTRPASTHLPDVRFPLGIRDSTTTSCEGQGGYYSCAVSEGGGCCPVGLVCVPAGCIQPSTTTTIGTSLICDPNWFQCSPSLGGKTTLSRPKGFVKCPNKHIN